MGGTAMAIPRWATEPAFYHDQVFVGTVLDVGGGPDPLAHHALPNVTRHTTLDQEPNQNPESAEWLVRYAWDIPAGRQWDCVYSSHCLEHVPIAELAQTRAAWWNAVKPGGHLVIIVPDMEMYERGHWPSRFNVDHKTRWVEDREPDQADDIMSLREFCVLVPER
jgi:SAM-dependent methyltransferase